MRFAKEMAFYSAYHQEKRNIWIHVFGVPTITFTLFLITTRWELFRIGDLPITFATAFAGAILLYYFTLDILFALVSTVVFGALLVIAHKITFTMAPSTVWTIFGVAQVLGWGAQFYGHFIFEKDRPALFDNLFQAVVSAPIFVVADVFFELGFRKDLEAEVKKVLIERGKLKTFQTAKAH
ncbi:hypothetical protein CH373_08970 [Leptospira perolatii]|uniref:DUF962 domain-containing protein n=1 Tax=Leptospira perolatii TaxID=2023191 RepID=A0A2M9ZNG9_9LEPT|nr:Mpo1-like protein [Leptospira perolatii]PJZ69625.1 hypothetical protein CH360_10115 [Leptospira perolatii]PJZ73612.1 hypothetical protein CH373_08970 [Leptospira perolatii]